MCARQHVLRRGVGGDFGFDHTVALVVGEATVNHLERGMRHVFAPDSAILTALANDVGPEVLFQRQLIAHGRDGDVALAFSTSGGSANILLALAEARRRGLETIAVVGYGGGQIAAEKLADHVIVAPSQYVPRIQEAHATAYHLLCELASTESVRRAALAQA